MTRTGEPVFDLSAETWKYLAPESAPDIDLHQQVSALVFMMFRFADRVQIDRLRLVESR